MRKIELRMNEQEKYAASVQQSSIIKPKKFVDTNHEYSLVSIVLICFL